MARMAALLLARDMISCAFAFLVGNSLALRLRALVTRVADDNDCTSLARWVPEGGDESGGVDEGGVATTVATPLAGVSEGRQKSSASLLLSSRRLVLLARSRLLLPECCVREVTLAAEAPPLAVGRNQRNTSSVTPSVSNTSLAGMPSLLQLTHAIY